MGYNHTQIGVVIIVPLIFFFVFVFAMFMGTGTFHPILILVSAVFAVALACFYSLNVEIRDRRLICRFGIGLIRKSILLSEINEARAVQNPWYAGWGIRWLPGQYWLWNVSGFRAVELALKDGNRFRIGTDEPELLVQAIEANKRMGT